MTDMVKLGPDSYVFVVEAMGKRYLIAQNKHAIQLLDRAEAGSFQEILQEKESEHGALAAEDGIAAEGESNIPDSSK